LLEGPISPPSDRLDPLDYEPELAGAYLKLGRDAVGGVATHLPTPLPEQVCPRMALAFDLTQI
jgi:hypothetical protein